MKLRAQAYGNLSINGSDSNCPSRLFTRAKRGLYFIDFQNHCKRKEIRMMAPYILESIYNTQL